MDSPGLSDPSYSQEGMSSKHVVKVFPVIKAQIWAKKIYIDISTCLYIQIYIHLYLHCSGAVPALKGLFAHLCLGEQYKEINLTVPPCSFCSCAFWWSRVLMSSSPKQDPQPCSGCDDAERQCTTRGRCCLPRKWRIR